ncbi:hypothetical protein BgiMline_016532 [Biomphalaria glabrata]
MNPQLLLYRLIPRSQDVSGKYIDTSQAHVTTVSTPDDNGQLMRISWRETPGWLQLLFRLLALIERCTSVQTNTFQARYFFFDVTPAS